MPGQNLLAGGDVEDESDLEVVELRPQAQEEEGVGSSEESEEEEGPGPPLYHRRYLFFVFPLFFFLY